MNHYAIVLGRKIGIPTLKKQLWCITAYEDTDLLYIPFSTGYDLCSVIDDNYFFSADSGWRAKILTKARQQGDSVVRSRPVTVSISYRLYKLGTFEDVDGVLRSMVYVLPGNSTSMRLINNNIFGWHHQPSLRLSLQDVLSLPSQHTNFVSALQDAYRRLGWN